MKLRFTFLLMLSMVSTAFGDPLVTPFSGIKGQMGYEDGIGDDAIFNDPMGLARDSVGNLYICDARNHVIRKVTPGGLVTTLAGKPGVAGAVDGVGRRARFRFPVDIAVAPNGVLYVADSGNHCIRVITTDGAVSTLAGDLGSANDIDSDRGLKFSVVSPQLDGKGPAARFNSPSGIAYAPGDFLYVSDTANHTIRKITLHGDVTTLAGKPVSWGATDGTGIDARFNTPMGLCIGADGNLYIADSMNHAIRCMTPKAAVSTFAGHASEPGCIPGPRREARFCNPTDVTPHPEGGFIICESFGNALFRLNADGMVSLFAGGSTSPTEPSSKTLSQPHSVVCDEQGNVYVADTFNQEVRLIIEKFETSISVVNGASQVTITWDSLPGRTYQLQIFRTQGWENSSLPPVDAVGEQTSTTFPMPAEKAGIYRILLLGF